MAPLNKFYKYKNEKDLITFIVTARTRISDSKMKKVKKKYKIVRKYGISK